MKADWTDASWRDADTLEVANFHPASSAHRPRTHFRMLYGPNNLYGVFKVEDCYVRCVRQNYFDDVWKDSCVECFLQPRADCGYFNFEFNCGGAFLCCYITDWRLKNGWFTEAVRLPFTIGGKVQIKTSLPRVVEPEITGPITWTLQFSIPIELFEEYLGPLGPLRDQTWRGNVFKCAEEISHPHWVSWSPIKQLNFHQPHCFGVLHFG